MSTTNKANAGKNTAAKASEAKAAKPAAQAPAGAQTAKHVPTPDDSIISEANKVAANPAAADKPAPAAATTADKPAATTEAAKPAAPAPAANQAANSSTAVLPTGADAAATGGNPGSSPAASNAPTGPSPAELQQIEGSRLAKRYSMQGVEPSMFSDKAIVAQLEETYQGVLNRAKSLGLSLQDGVSQAVVSQLISDKEHINAREELAFSYGLNPEKKGLLSLNSLDAYIEGRENDKKAQEEAQAKEAESHLSRVKKYGENYVVARKGEQETIFTQTAWQMLKVDPKTGNKDGWNQVIDEPEEVKALRNR